MQKHVKCNNGMRRRVVSYLIQLLMQHTLRRFQLQVHNPSSPPSMSVRAQQMASQHGAHAIIFQSRLHGNDWMMHYRVQSQHQLSNQPSFLRPLVCQTSSYATYIAPYLPQTPRGLAQFDQPSCCLLLLHARTVSGGEERGGGEDGAAAALKRTKEDLSPEKQHLGERLRRKRAELDRIIAERRQRLAGGNSQKVGLAQAPSHGRVAFVALPPAPAAIGYCSPPEACYTPDRSLGSRRCQWHPPCM